MANEPRRSALHITVVYTTAPGTRLALAYADEVARGRRARITLLVPQVVPFHASLREPPVTSRFFRELGATLAREQQHPVRIRVFACRDPEALLKATIRRDRRVLIGAASRWRWRERSIRRRLERLGHPVTLVTPAEVVIGRQLTVNS